MKNYIYFKLFCYICTTVHLMAANCIYKIINKFPKNESNRRKKAITSV